MVHKQKDKGDVAAAKVIADLTVKDYAVFVPAVTEHLPFDLIAYKDGVSHRIQCKYDVNGFVSNKSVWNDKHGTHVKVYKETDFDYYALYLPQIDKVVYPSISFGGITIRHDVPNSATPFYWWEDFLEFTLEASKKVYRDFGVELTHKVTDKVIEGRIKRRKVVRPSRDELIKLLAEKPKVQIAKDFGVSDKAIAKWAIAYDIT